MSKGKFGARSMQLVGFVFVKEKRWKFTLKKDLGIEQPKQSFKKTNFKK